MLIFIGRKTASCALFNKKLILKNPSQSSFRNYIYLHNRVIISYPQKKHLRSRFQWK